MPRPTASRRAPALAPQLARALAAGALLAVLLPLPARAALAVRTSVEELARTSDAVVRGRVERRSSHRAGTRIYTEVEVRAAAVWRGRAPAVVKVVVPGGVVGDVGQRVDAAPVFEAGEEVVVFLSAGPGGAHRVNGLAQGKFQVEGTAVRPDLRDTSFVRSELARGERGAEPMALAELERRVKEAR